MKYLVKKTKEGVRIDKLIESSEGKLPMTMTIELRDGDVVTDEQKPYPLVTIYRVGEKYL